jgi:hypothetical protein
MPYYKNGNSKRKVADRKISQIVSYKSSMFLFFLHTNNFHVTSGQTSLGTSIPVERWLGKTFPHPFLYTPILSNERNTALDQK